MQPDQPRYMAVRGAAERQLHRGPEYAGAQAAASQCRAAAHWSEWHAGRRLPLGRRLLAAILEVVGHLLLVPQLHLLKIDADVIRQQVDLFTAGTVGSATSRNYAQAATGMPQGERDCCYASTVRAGRLAWISSISSSVSGIGDELSAWTSCRRSSSRLFPAWIRIPESPHAFFFMIV